MLRRPFAWSLVFCLICPFAAEANECDQRVKIYESVKKGCDTQGQFCEDVDRYCELALKSCGQKKGLNCKGTPSGAGSGASVEGDPPPNNAGSEVPSYSADNLPADCAFFTRPAWECDGMRSHYYDAGAFVCFQKYMYECVQRGPVRTWVKRATCNSYGNWRNLQAEKLENSNKQLQKCSLYEN